MNDDVVQDLKQFIAATVSQSTSDVRRDIKGIRSDINDMRGGIEKLDRKVDSISESVADALDVSNQANHDQLMDHETRIAKLEQKPA